MDNHSLSPPREAYHLARKNDDAEDEYASVATSIQYSEFSHNTSHHNHRSTTVESYHDDASAGIHEMHLALMYLLSHPEEFVLPEGHATLSDWNQFTNTTNHNNDDDESLTTAGGTTTTATTALQHTPLPCIVFADDAEVVLPQAHTASQLFGMELDTGMELEAAAGIPNICSLFRRWLAIFPGSDHLHLIDPPGITIMRIAGNRYRVTAAHECIWTWRNEFLANQHVYSYIKVGDLVCLTMVDVFETDKSGKLLSYCPTFDNRAVQKVDRNLYRLRKHTASLKQALEKSPLLRAISQQATSLAHTLKQKVDSVVYGTNETDDDGSRHSILGIPSYCLGDENDDDGLERHEV